MNDNGGTATVADFTLTADGAGRTTCRARARSTRVLTCRLTRGRCRRRTLAGYAASDWICVGGTQNRPTDITVGLGGEATCTITNDDIAPKLHLRKVVVNDNGGTADGGRLHADG